VERSPRAAAPPPVPHGFDRPVVTHGMDDTVERALGRALSDDVPWELLTRLTELPERFGGHPGERIAAERVATAFQQAGVADVETRPFELTRWSRGETTLAVAGDRPRSFEAVALPYSPSGTWSGPLVDVGRGTADEIDAADPSGGLAVASTAPPRTHGRHVHRMETVGHAVEAGAAGIVFANHRAGQLPPTGTLRFGEGTGVPGVGVSQETGEWLREYADRGREARLQVEATTEPAESQNVVGRLGPATDEAVLVLAHYDAHDVGEGALDNGAGVAVLLGALRVLADLDLDRRVLVAAVGCEEIGLLGSEALAERLAVDRLRAVVNLDGAGRFRDARALVHGSEPVAERVEAVTDQLAVRVVVNSQPHSYSDHWPFLRAGVPSLQFHSSRPDDAGPWDRGWTHTRADTRDKVDPRNLREHARLAALAVRELAARPPAPLSPERVCDRLRECGAEPGMRAAGVWPEQWD